MRQRSMTLLAAPSQGIVTMPHSLDELKADMRRVFGAQTVQDWETLGKARLAERRKRKP